MPSHKRSFDEFAEPLPPFKWGRPYEHNNKTCLATHQHNNVTGVTTRLEVKQIEPIEPIMVPLYDHATKRPLYQHATVKNLTNHGIPHKRFISGLTNKIHPIFRRVCCCKFTNDRFCLHRDARPVRGKNTRAVPVPEIASPLPSDNFVIGTIMQLATRILTSDESLQFISALLDCGKKGVQFHVRPRERLSAERKQATLARLVSYVDRIAIHFREFSRKDTKPPGGLLAYTTKLITRHRRRPPHIIVDVEQIKGYDSGAAGYDQLVAGDLRRTIVRSAIVLCHELMHAITWLEVQAKDEPKFNNEPFAEVGHAYEGFVLGGLIFAPLTSGSIWLRQWPPMGRLNGYKVFRKGIYSTAPQPGAQWVDETVYVEFLKDQFWDTETKAPPANRRCKPFKKLWLRTHHETPRTLQEFTYYASGYEEPPVRGNQIKRRRLADTETECWRWKDDQKALLSTGGTLTSRRIRSVRCKVKKQKQKDEFHEREQMRLNQAWVNLVPNVTF
jgi:hypothetical protein